MTDNLLFRQVVAFVFAAAFTRALTDHTDNVSKAVLQRKIGDLKVERVQSVSLTPDTYPPQDDSVAREMRAAWDVVGDDTPVEVVIRFDPTVTQRVHETRWHPSQVEELEDDGSLVWRARVSGLLEIRSWILGWGPDAEVLEPDGLRDWVAKRHAEAAANYQD